MNTELSNTKKNIPLEIKHLLWATDFSEESLHCIPYLKLFHEKLQTENHALYVLPKLSDWVYETAYISSSDLLDTINETRQNSIEKIESASQDTGIPFQALVKEGLASEEIIQYSHQNNIDLIFAGRRGISEIEEILIGSTTSRLIRNSDVPVMVIPKTTEDIKLEKILCPIDFNELSMLQLEYAITLARQLKAKLYVAHISEFFNFKIPVFQREKLIEEINERIDNIAKDLGYEVENIIYDIGEPGQKIIEIARANQINIITMATHQRQGIKQFFLGSITEKVLMYSNIPVIVLPPLGIDEENGDSEA